MKFSRRKLEGSRLLGERLRELREEERLTRQELANRLSIPVRYIQALEESAYAALPSDVYVKNYLRKIALELHVGEGRVLSWYERERDVARGADERMAQPLTPPQGVQAGFFIAPRVVRYVLFGVALLAVAGYLGWQLQRVFKAPPLVITEPTEDSTTTERSVTIAGNTEPEAQVRVNDREIPVDRSGAFREQVNLRDGLNTIRITAKRGRSAVATVQRLIFVENAATAP